MRSDLGPANPGFHPIVSPSPISSQPSVLTVTQSPAATMTVVVSASTIAALRVATTPLSQRTSPRQITCIARLILAKLDQCSGIGRAGIIVTVTAPRSAAFVQARAGQTCRPVPADLRNVRRKRRTTESNGPLRHSSSIRLASFTAHPITVKSSRRLVPTLP